MPDQPGLAGAVAVVTGGSRGIGKQTALELARLGAVVVLASRTEQERPGTPGTLHETARAIEAEGGRAVVIRADVSRQEDLDALVTGALAVDGHVDVLINNAAYTVGKALFAHVPDITRDQWDKHFATNVTAPLMLMQGFWGSMRQTGRGVIVNVTSGAAAPQSIDEERDIGIPEEGPGYGSSKAALNRLANAVARDGAAHRIAVINVEPGFVLTETMAATFAATGVTETSAISPNVPARAIAYLCSCSDPMQYSGTVVSAPELVATLGLLP